MVKLDKLSAETMKKIRSVKSRRFTSDDMLPEYSFDYRKARPNRFAARMDENRLVVVLDPEVARVFTTPESVNEVLHALITAMPTTAKSKTARRSSIT